MQVLIDGTPLFHSASTFTDILDAARIEARRQGRVIVGIEVGGSPWAPGATDGPAADQLEGKDVNMVTDDPRVLVRRTLLDAAELLKATGPRHHETAMLIQSGKLGEGMQQLGRTISAWESARAAINQSAALLGISIEDLLSTPDTDRQTLHLRIQSSSESIQQLEGSLHEVKRAVKDRDWSGLADVLEYEMPGICVAWERLLTAAAGKTPPGPRPVA